MNRAPGFSDFIRWILSIELFDFFRYVLGTVVTIYATVITIQSLWGWYLWLKGEDRYIGLLRRYLIVHGLRLRFGSFWGDVLISLLLCVAFFILWHAHGLIYDLEKKVRANQELAQKIANVEQSKSAKFR